MKKLNQFNQFNFGAFAKDKQFMIQSVKWNEKKHCVSVDVVITVDNTAYDDENVSNIYEKFKVHLIKDTDEEDVTKYHSQDKIIFKQVGKCAVWGDYMSNLSIEAVIEVVE